jgi:hypothetical protein
VTSPRIARAERKLLLLGTALASTLLLASLCAATPARALTNCLTGNPPPGPITVAVADDIICVNVDNRSNAGAVINLSTTGGNNYINLYNSGILTANAAGTAADIETITTGGNSPISIVNVSNIAATSTGGVAFGILGQTFDGNSPLSIVNSGGFAITSATAAPTASRHGPMAPTAPSASTTAVI